MNEGKNPVPKGVYNCELIDAMRSGKSNHTMHYILSLRLKPTETGVENPCEYYAELPIIFKTGAEFNFYNRETKMSERRKATSADTKAAVEYARKCVPAWAEYCDSLPDGATFADGFAWFDNIPAETLVRAAVKEPREYNGKTYYEATIYEQRGVKSAVGDADDFCAEFGAIIKAAGLKFGGKSAAPKVAAAQKQTATAKSAPVPPKKPTPPAPAATARVFTSEDAWNAYEGGERIKGDPNGANYWGEVEKIVGKPASEYGNYTSDDWRKCVTAFGGVDF